MKIVALLMGMTGLVFVWCAFQIQFLKRLPLSLRGDARFGKPGSRRGRFALYYVACATAAIYFSALFYWDERAAFPGIPAMCASLAVWRLVLFRRTSGSR